MESVSRSSSSLEEGPEYRVMRECNAMMVNLLKHSIDSLGDELYGKQLIPLDVKEKIRFIPIPADKTRKVLDCITDRVKYNPQTFHEYIKILEKTGTWTKLMVDHLLSCYQSQTATPQSSSSLTPSPSQGGKLRLQYSLPEGMPSEVIRALESVTISILHEDKVC